MSGQVGNRNLRRLLVVTPDYPPTVGGIQRLLYGVTRALEGVAVEVLTSGDASSASFDQSASQTIRRLRPIASARRTRHAWLNVQIALARPQVRPDAVLNGHVVTSPGAWLLARRLRLPLLTYAYGKEVLGHPHLARWAGRRSQQVIAISEYTRDILLSVAGVEPDAIRIVYPGVDIPPVAPSRKSAAPTIVTVGRLRDSYKGHDKVIEALPTVVAAVPDLRWVIVGDGPLRPQLERSVAEHGLTGSVIFVGEVSDIDLDRELRSAHLFVMPTRYPAGEVAGEGFAMVFIEAAVRGVPGLAGDKGGPAEAVQNGVTGVSVDAEDPKQIADSIIELLSDRVRLEMLGRNAEARARREFSWEVAGGRLREAIEGVL